MPDEFNPNAAICDLIGYHARKRPGADALVFEGRRLSWAEFDLRVNQVANGIIAADIGRAGMVAILADNSLEYFVTLFGITMRNGIMMVSHWQHLREQEGVEWGPELIYRGARERLAPVLMTALVTGLGLLPIALGSGEAGREIEGPMALVILGGLVTSTALNLLVLPVLYRRFGN